MGLHEVAAKLEELQKKINEDKFNAHINEQKRDRTQSKIKRNHSESALSSVDDDSEEKFDASNAKLDASWKRYTKKNHTQTHVKHHEINKAPTCEKLQSALEKSKTPGRKKPPKLSTATTKPKSKKGSKDNKGNKARKSWWRRFR